MRKPALLGGIAATLLGASVVMAASPAPSARPSTSPAASPAPAASPPPAPSGSSTSAPKVAVTAGRYTAALRPLTLGGTATITKTSTGATLRLRLTGVIPGQAWNVEVHRAPIATADTQAAIFTASGQRLDRWSDDTLTFDLTQTQYDALHAARMAHGVIVMVRSGDQAVVATLAKA